MEPSSSFLSQIDFLAANKTRNACAIAGPFVPFIDHVIPIAAILDIPLITKEPSIAFTYKKYYPPFKCELKEWSLHSLIENYSTIFYGFSLETTSFKQIIQTAKKNHPHESIWHLPTQFIYHLHGCSDKGYRSDWFDPKGHLLDVDKVLVYGKRMQDLLEDKNVHQHTKLEWIGNYRYSYYLEHRDFFDSMIQKEVFKKFKKKQTTILYAPTWNDKEDSSSLFKAYGDILSNLPSSYNLILKLHPNLSVARKDYDPKTLYELLTPYAKKGNVLILPLLPNIYPILSHIDIYLGDHSSVGYDALAFNTPLFFINHHKRSYLTDKSAYLLRCGTNIYPEDLKNIYSIIDKEIPLDHQKYDLVKQETYSYAFGETLPYSQLKEHFKNLIL